ncbi:hypothetical protein E3N88_14509 [Mikania micrantha]|uniref:Uncharacterized protein n=1 Tax=Mikania micrantha TaxID=192012 RepID=A0A5N6P1P9_9ASTR|nr:hypothetical protein E3N88_14509 [Mikania micrantha]
MLDLNLSIGPTGDSTTCNSSATTGDIMETMNDEDDHLYSCLNVAYRFDILKKNDLQLGFHETGSGMTEVLPAIGGDGGVTVVPPHHWVDNGENIQSMDLNLGIAPPSLTGGIQENDTLENLNRINILGDMSSQAATTMGTPSTAACWAMWGGATPTSFLSAAASSRFGNSSSSSAAAAAAAANYHYNVPTIPPYYCRS